MDPNCLDCKKLFAFFSCTRNLPSEILRLILCYDNNHFCVNKITDYCTDNLCDWMSEVHSFSMLKNTGKMKNIKNVIVMFRSNYASSDITIKFLPECKTKYDHVYNEDICDHLNICNMKKLLDVETCIHEIGIKTNGHVYDVKENALLSFIDKKIAENKWFVWGFRYNVVETEILSFFDPSDKLQRWANVVFNRL